MSIEIFPIFKPCQVQAVSKVLNFFRLRISDEDSFKRRCRDLDASSRLIQKKEKN